MGKLAGELLLEAVRGRAPEPTLHRVPCELVLRQSSGTR
jgi:DNA-binding LacI/PurR family transcriptional regulator